MAYYELQEGITVNSLKAKLIETKELLSQLKATEKECKGVLNSRNEQHKVRCWLQDIHLSATLELIKQNVKLPGEPYGRSNCARC